MSHTVRGAAEQGVVADLSRLQSPYRSKGNAKARGKAGASAPGSLTCPPFGANWTRGISPEARTDCKPRANNCPFRGEKGCCVDSVDAGNPLQYGDFPLVSVLSSVG